MKAGVKVCLKEEKKMEGEEEEKKEESHGEDLGGVGWTLCCWTSGQRCLSSSGRLRRG